MCSYSHTITWQQAYIEKLSLLIKIKLKGLEQVSTMPLVVYILYEIRGTVTKEGERSLHLSIKNYDTQVNLQGFDITWQTAPSQTWLITKPKSAV